MNNEIAEVKVLSEQDEKKLNKLKKLAKRHDIDIDVGFELGTNKYFNRRHIRDLGNKISSEFFPKTHERNVVPRILIDMHVIERLGDREFPFDEFVQILCKLGTICEQNVLDIVDAQKRGESRPVRINCYGYGNLMLGVTIHSYHDCDHKDAYHIVVRTCYAERKLGWRVRQVETQQIWTRGIPKWYSEIKQNMELKNDQHDSTVD
ncbi:MAG: hypothetical protein ACRCWQ_10910 [Bacilli bacterium]